MFRIALVSLACLLTSGCASLHEASRTPTGEPLEVSTGYRTERWTTQEKIGESTIRDSRGQVIAKSETFADQQHSAQVFEWNVSHGRRAIDDEDFFRIGGDDATADEIRASRSRGVTLNRVGLGLLAGGLSVMAGAFAINMATKSGERGATTTGSLPLNLLSLVGLAVGGTGGYLTFFGYRMSKKVHPVDDYRRAVEVARVHNAQYVR